MSPRKTRRGAKIDGPNETILEPIAMKPKENTPPPSQRVLRTRKLTSQDSDADQTLNKSQKIESPLIKSTRSRKKAPVENVINDSSSGLNESTGTTRRRTKKAKGNDVSLEQTNVLESSMINESQIENSRKRRKRGVTKQETKSEDEEVLYEGKKKTKNGAESAKENSIIEIVSEEDIEVEKTVRNLRAKNVASTTASPRTVAKGRTRNEKSKLLEVTTPESSPITVHLSPHRTTKTPRKSPMNLGSPKTHAEEPLRLSKTPRKLPVVEESPATSERSTSSLAGTPKRSPSSKNDAEKKGETDTSGAKKKKRTPKKNSPIKGSPGKDNFERKFSKSPKIVLKTPKSKTKRKSPQVVSSKANKLPRVSPSRRKNSQSPNKTSLSNENSKSGRKSPKNTTSLIIPTLDANNGSSELDSSNNAKPVRNSRNSMSTGLVGNIEKKLLTIVLDNCQSPMNVVEKRGSSTRRSNSNGTEVEATERTPIKSPNKEERTSQGERPRRSSPGKTGIPSRGSARSPRVSPDSSKLSRSPFVSLSTEFIGSARGRATQNAPRMLSSTPRERIRRDLDLSPGLTSTPARGNFIKKGGRSSSQDDRNCRSLLIDDVSNPLISEDDDSFSLKEASGQDSRLDGTFEIAKKTLNEEEEIEDKPADGTYELAEPKTPVLRKKAGKRSIVEIETSIEGRSPKRACRVRFASTPPTTPENKQRARDSSRARSATPGQRVNQKRTPVVTITKGVENTRRMSNSLVNISSTKTPMATLKRRSNSISSGLHTISASKTAQNASVNRLSKPRLAPANSDKKIEVKTPVPRKAPNFAQIHEKKFAKMESLVDAKRRVEKRHLAMNSKIPTNLTKVNTAPRSNMKNSPKTSNHRINDAYTRFGFKLRKNEAVQIVSERKSIGGGKKKQSENRELLKGVRTNRRFELIMKARNIN